MYVNLSSQMLGMFDWLLEGLFHLLGTALKVIMIIFETVLAQVFFSISSILISIVDFFQTLFQRLAGIEPHYLKGKETSNDIILSIIQNKDIQNVFLAMCILAVALLIMATVIAIFKSEYSQEAAKTSKGSVIGASLRAIALFITVPLVSVMGIYIGNQLLKALDGVFSAGSAGSQSLSAKIFLASAKSANRAYIESGSLEEEWDEKIKTLVTDALGGGFANMGGVFDRDSAGNIKQFKSAYSNGGMFNANISGTSHEEIVYSLANTVDQAFANKIEMTGETLERFYINSATSSLFGGGGLGGSLTLAVRATNAVNTLNPTFDFSNMTAVSMYYNISSINYLILIPAAIFMMSALLSVSFGLIMRLFKAIGLLVVSPAIVALYPIDNGKAFGQWRTQFIGVIVSVYGVVVAINAMFLIMAAVAESGFTIFPNATVADALRFDVYNSLVTMLIALVGIQLVKDFSKAISGIISNGEDVLANGANNAINKSIQGTVKGVAKAGVGMAVGGFVGAKGLASFKAKEIDGNKSKLQGFQDVINDPNATQEQKIKASADMAATKADIANAEGIYNKRKTDLGFGAQLGKRTQGAVASIGKKLGADEDFVKPLKNEYRDGGKAKDKAVEQAIVEQIASNKMLEGYNNQSVSEINAAKGKINNMQTIEGAMAKIDGNLFFSDILTNKEQFGKAADAAQSEGLEEIADLLRKVEEAVKNNKTTISDAGFRRNSAHDEIVRLRSDANNDFGGKHNIVKGELSSLNAQVERDTQINVLVNQVASEYNSQLTVNENLRKMENKLNELKSTNKFSEEVKNIVSSEVKKIINQSKTEK